MPHGAEEIPLQFRAKSVLAELPGSIAPPTSQATPRQLFVSGSVLWCPWTPNTWVTQSNVQARQFSVTDIEQSFSLHVRW